MAFQENTGGSFHFNSARKPAILVTGFSMGHEMKRRLTLERTIRESFAQKRTDKGHASRLHQRTPSRTKMEVRTQSSQFVSRTKRSLSNGCGAIGIAVVAVMRGRIKERQFLFLPSMSKIRDGDKATHW